MRVMIVDDEPLAREHLRTLLREHAEIDLVGEAGDAAEALARIERLAPELLFLDIRMPDCDGFELLRRLADPPPVVFTTAYDEHALRAIEAEAVHYLLKPVDPARLSEAIERRLRHGAPAKPRFRSRIAARSGERTVLLAVEDIDWIEPVSNYAKVHVGAHAYYIRSTIASLEAELDAERFVRIHRSIIVNVERIAEIDKGVDGRAYAVRLKSGACLEMQRSFARRLRTLVGRF